MSGLPYMGSKRKLAPKILDKILTDNPNAEYFWDLFGGGGAVSVEALKRQRLKGVHYNELNKAIVSLMVKLRDEGVTSDMFYWVSREKFYEDIKRTDWRGGIAQSCWSFGNNQKDYLFGRDVEPEKKLIWDIAINRDEVALSEFCDKYKVELDSDTLFFDAFGDKTSKQIRLSIRQAISQRVDLQSLERLERLERLGITNLSFESVKITTPIEKTIIYLDPPYDKTAGYQEQTLIKDVYKYIEQSPYKIYMSSYESHLECVEEYIHRSILSATANNEVIEKLFTNNKPTLGVAKQHKEIKTAQLSFL